MAYELRRKSYYETKFQGRSELFEYCWKRYRKHLSEGGFDEPTSDSDVMQDLEELAGHAVNDGDGNFYIYG